MNAGIVSVDIASDGAVPALVAVLLGGAAWCAVSALRRAPASVGVARASMYGTADDGSEATGWHTTRLGSHLTQSARRRFGSGLQLVDLTPADVATKVLVAGAVFLLGSLALLAGLAAVGALQVRFWSPAVSVALAGLGGWTAWRGIASSVERERRAVRQAANDFVQLVAVGLTTDQSVEEAIRFALDVGAGDGSERLRRQVLTAPQRGVAVWDAIEEFGQTYEVRELCEFAVSVERQGTQGVSIGETVGALAAGMRSRALDELEREADRANANLSGPTVGFVVATVVFLAYPLAQRISEAFGG